MTPDEFDGDGQESMFAQAAREYREEEERKVLRFERREESQRTSDGKRTPKVLPTITAASLAGQVTQRQFLDDQQLFPLRNVFMISGDGAVGKSLLMLQLAVACTTGTKWLGLEVAQGPVVYYCCEDDRVELANRYNEICQAEGIDPHEAFTLHFAARAGLETVLAVESNGLLRRTELFADLALTIEDIQPVVSIIDNLADVYAANENSRTLARQFVNMLHNLAIQHDSIIGLVAHPSLSGISSGTGTSGSTAWNNSVRSRLYMSKPAKEPDTNPNARTLEIMKSNYSVAGRQIYMEWQQGRFVPSVPVNPFDSVTAAQLEQVQRAFKTAQYKANPQAGDDWGGWLVAEICGLDAGRGLKDDERSASQKGMLSIVKQLLNRWQVNGAIRIVKRMAENSRVKPFFAGPEELASHDGE